MRKRLSFYSYVTIALTQIITLILVSAIATTSSNECRKFTCENLQPQECLSISNNDRSQVIVSPCTSSTEVCLYTVDLNLGSFSNFSCMNISNITSNLKYPGESCVQNTDCLNNNCTNSTLHWLSIESVM